MRRLSELLRPELAAAPHRLLAVVRVVHRHERGFLMGQSELKLGGHRGLRGKPAP